MDESERAEEVFAALQDAMHKDMISGADLPEILNNLAVARARLGKGAVAQTDLARATEIDPEEDDYPFNLGLVALRSNDAAAAAIHFREAVEREPDNPEDRALLILALDRAGKKAEADQERESATETFGPSGIPAIHLDAKGEALGRLDRIKMELDTTMLRLELKSGETAASSAVSDSMAAANTSAAHIRKARQELSAGHVDVAEREFRIVLTADPANAAAHRGLAEIARRQGKLEDAVKEFQASLEARDSAEVRTELARIYLEQRKTDLARAEVDKALKLAPNYSEAKQLLERLKNSKVIDKKPGGGA
jgi:Tfp pilus assembly protein PilF